MYIFLKSKYSRLFAFNQVNRDRWIATQAFSLPTGSRVLDVGAGSCPYRTLFKHCEYRTQDFVGLKDEQLRYGGYCDIDYVCDARAIPVPDRSFDAIVCTEVIEHVPEPIAIVYELARLLRPGGILILTAPLGSGIHQAPFHFYGGYTPFWYKRFLAEAGFENIQIEANGGFYLHFGQEAIRFIMMSAPWNINLSSFAKIIWTIPWLCLAPIFGIIVPLLAHIFDSTDYKQDFTVGYHVTATRLHNL